LTQPLDLALGFGEVLFEGPLSNCALVPSPIMSGSAFMICFSA